MVRYHGRNCPKRNEASSLVLAPARGRTEASQKGTAGRDLCVLHHATVEANAANALTECCVPYFVSLEDKQPTPILLVRNQYVVLRLKPFWYSLLGYYEFSEFNLAGR